MENESSLASSRDFQVAPTQPEIKLASHPSGRGMGIGIH